MPLSERVDALMILDQSRRIVDAETLLRTPVSELDGEALITAWSVLDLMSKELIKTRTEDLRDALLIEAETRGKKGVTSGNMPKFTLKIGGGTVTSTQMAGKVSYDEVELKLLLDELGINHAIVFKSQVVTVLDEDALEKLVVSGRISPDDVKRFATVAEPSRRLKVVKPAAVLALLPEGDSDAER